MDCERCQPLLIDVACDALDASAAAEVLAHARACVSCGPALQKLQRGLSFAAQLPEREPSARVSERIMELAREHTLATRALATPVASHAAHPRSFADTVREFLGQFAMGRQFAMATVMVLVTAVGLWLVPRARQHELAAGNVVNPDPEGEAGPSNGIVPAAPLDLDLRQGRIRPRDEAPVARVVRPTVDAQQATERSAQANEFAKRADVSAEEAETSKQASADLARDDISVEARELGATPQATAAGAGSSSNAGEFKARPRAAATALDEGTRGGGYAAVAEADAPAGSSYAREQEAPQPDAEAVPSTAFAPPPAAPQPRAARSAGASAGVESVVADDVGSSAPAAPAKSDHLAEAFTNYRAAQYDKAIAAFELVRRDNGDQLTPAARLALARSYQRTSRCAQAVTHFEIVLRSATSNREVMLETAACYRTLGRTADASTMTARANALPSNTSTSKGDAPAAAVRE